MTQSEREGGGLNVAACMVSLKLHWALHVFQMKPTRCTLMLSRFISTFLHVSCNYVPIIIRTCCIYATLVFFTLYGWLSGLSTRQPPPDDGHIVARNM